MPWPAQVVRQFEKVPPNPSESDFHGPYNKLLNSIFPWDSSFTVVPQYMPIHTREAADYIVMFEVHLVDRPVFILELKSPQHILLKSTRAAADTQIRTRIEDIAEHCPLPVLHAVSAMGTRLYFYRRPQAGPTEPPAIFGHSDYQLDTAPAGRWDCDILEEEGTARFQVIVEEIKQGCEGL